MTLSSDRIPDVPIDPYIVDTLMRDLVGHDHKPASFLVYLSLSTQQARQRQPIQISYHDLAENIGISKSSVQSAVTWLVRRKLLSATRETVTATPTYTIHTPWRNHQQKPRIPNR